MTDPTTGTLRADAMAILHAGVSAADPEKAVRRSLRLEGSTLRTAGGIAVELWEGSGVLLLAVGKAAEAMAAAAAERLGRRITAGTVTVPASGPGREWLEPQVPVPLARWTAGHPLPDLGGLAAAAEALSLARRAKEEDTVLCLLSGGASAMWAAPAGGLTLEQLRAASTALLRSGAPIEDVNTVRKHLSAIAGGRLASAARPARVLTLSISDVIGVGPEAIGSGPTLPDPTTYADALEVVRAYEVALPTPLLHHLRRGAAGAFPDTPGPGELPNVLGMEIVLSIDDAVAGAAEEARRLGYEVRIRSSALQGEAREAGARMAAESRRVRADGGRGVALLWGGETTVTVRGGGTGGRNQEVALAAAVGLAEVKGMVFAAMGTDGRDGPTDAAGGLVDGGTVTRGAALGLDAAAHLHANDSHSYLRSTGDLIVTGLTGTNVNDLALALISASPGEG